MNHTVNMDICPFIAIFFLLKLDLVKKIQVLTYVYILYIFLYLRSIRN